MGIDLKIFVTIAEKMVTCPYCRCKKKSESNVATSKNEMEDEWDTEELCVIEEDKLALMTMMGEHIDYEDDLIIDSWYSNHMTNNQSAPIEAVWPSKKEILP